MEMDPNYTLSLLEKKMRLLPNKKRHLESLEACINPQATVFDKQRIAFGLYRDIYGCVYTQPEFASQMRLRDVVAKRRFGLILKGVMTYFNASQKRKEQFKKRILSRPFFLSALFHRTFQYQRIDI